MRRIVALLVAAGAMACAGAPVLPSAGSSGAPRAGHAGARTRSLPDDPKAQWHVEPNAAGVALELHF